MNEPSPEFAAAATAYCAWCAEAPAPARTEAQAALAHLERLCALASTLRASDDEPDIEGEPLPDAAWHATYERFAALAQAIEPDADEADGDLADDLSDIQRDLWEGLTVHKDGEPENATWIWAWSYRTHWSEHAAHAQEVLRRWLAGPGA